ncbi:nucleotidyltransferase family protein [Conexibacter sp. CPCC 206217]|uniref:nucleotidyltransferase family protein n=1 Tax=Conexibacter sp. CPCC 206217 TaxID=3064574 RepID=UPI0027178FD2|nr:nucleotidyltransferase family protein [Conexibacter sp. CPCC 206217]MDO8209064.1 nucleotidyltransferase family protein [Conexibacter sp. CPCC 206217]
MRADAAGASRVAGLVLAAGAARRFGGRKQLAPLDGRPLLEHALAAMAGAGLTRVAVTLGAHADEIVAAIDLHGAQAVVVADWDEGLAASLRAGVAALAPHADAIVVTLGDQPRISSAAIARVAAVAAEAGGAPAARATYDGRPGHPILLRRELFPAIAELRGDSGARELLATVDVRAVECGTGTAVDVDTPEQLRGLGG